ncbi:MAG: NAD-dependent protein deacylase [Kordiimonas sp.]|nr:NAD-dependent protein deacylase [Kordiimonas sp.]
MRSGERIVILTGAGISAESGLETYRDGGGLWEKYDLMELATLEAFAARPDVVLDFYNMRRRAAEKAQPNAAHLALARLESAFDGQVDIITQNVDGLHEAAGSRNLWHMHGCLNQMRCMACGGVHDWAGNATRQDKCPTCGEIGRLRPHIVWFGEMPHHMPEIQMMLAQCDLFISIGTSGTVYPAAGFAAAVQEQGRAQTVELNLEPSQGNSPFDIQYYGPATEIVPHYVNQLLRSEREKHG